MLVCVGCVWSGGEEVSLSFTIFFLNDGMTHSYSACSRGEKTVGWLNLHVEVCTFEKKKWVG